MILVNFKIIHIIFSVILFLLFLLSTSQRAFSETYLSQNLSMGCKFVFSNYFKNTIKIKNNNAIFSINQKDPSVLFSTTDELDVSIQITVKKINNPKSPTITLFMALEKGKKYGNFIIPNLRQNLCSGKFIKYSEKINIEDKTQRQKKLKENKVEENAPVKKEKENRLKLEQEKIKKKAEELRAQEIKKGNILKAEQEKIKKKAAEVARKKRLKEEKERKKKLVEEKAKRNAQIKAQKLAKEKAKLKAQKLAEEKAEIKNDTLEHVNMIQDIEVFSSKQNIFDPIKIGTLFVKLDNSKKNKWTINSSKVYRELKKYVFSFNEFKDFREQRKQNRLNIENESLDILSKNLNSKISLLKEYISKNLRSKNIPIVIEFISKIEKELAKKNVKSLKILNQKVQEWISKNIKNSKTKNKTKTIKTEDRQTIPLSKDNSIRFDLLSSAIISKEFGDGFSNYEANKNNYLCGLILKINNISKKSYNTKDLNFRVTFDSNRVVQEAKDVSQAFTLQEGLDNIGGTTLKPGANYSTGIGFILPSTELDTKYILLEVLKNKKIIFQQKILSTKN